MATYDYKCDECGVFEFEQRMSDPVLTECPRCLEKGKHIAVERLLSAPAFHLKGGGWYKTDYASGGSSNGSQTKSADTSTSSESKETVKEEKKSLKTVPDGDKGGGSSGGGCGSGCGCH